MLNYEVGKKFVRTAKSWLTREACKAERGDYIECLQEEEFLTERQSAHLHPAGEGKGAGVEQADSRAVHQQQRHDQDQRGVG